MAITFERADTIDDATFDTLFAASLDDIKSGTLIYPDTITTDEELKEYVKNVFNEHNYAKHGILVKKDTTPINWIVGNHNPSDTYTWALVLNGTINGSKAIFYSAEWHTAHKAYQQSIGVSKYIIPCIKDSRVDVYFQRLQADGVCLGTYEKIDYSLTNDGNTISHTWEY